MSRSRASNLASSRPLRIALLAVVALAWAAFAHGVYRDLSPRGGSPFATIAATPMEMKFESGVWYWVERPKSGPARLVRAGNHEAEQIVTADEITSYDVTGKGVAWIQRQGKSWSTYVIPTGGARREIPAQSQPRGLRLIGDRVYWLRPKAGVARDTVPIPAVQTTLEVVSAPISGGPETVSASLLETDGQIVGMSGGDLYVLGIRNIAPLNTAIYRIPAGGGPKRVVGESGASRAIVTRDGALYWTAKTRESSEAGSVCCIRRLTREGRTETVTDWLLSDGILYDTDRGLIYVDGFGRPSAWRLDGGLPRLVPISRDFIPLAAGGSEILLWDITAAPPRVRLARMALP